MVFDFFRRAGTGGALPAAPEAKASATGRVVAWGVAGSGRVAWSARDTATLTRIGFTGNPVGFRCVKLVAEAAAAVPLLCQDAECRYDVHPMLELIRRPNTLQGRAELLESLYGQMLLSGNGYLEAVGGEAGLPGELHVLRSDRMSIVPGADGWPVAYDYTVGARRHRFDMTGEPDPICHIRSFHPQDDHYGLSPMQAAAVAVDVHNSASAWSKALLDNAARPSGAIVYKGADGQGQLSADQYDRLVSEMEMHHQGARNAGRPMLLEGGLRWQAMSLTPAEMDFVGLKAAAAREIALAFGVPPMLMGLPGDNSYANYREANKALWRQTILPLVAKIGAGLGQGLAGWWPGLRIEADLDGVAALSDERAALWDRVVAADFLTGEEKRALLGI